MLAAGNYDMMKPLFKMYIDALPLARHRVRQYHKFGGAYFPETIYFWGAHSNQDYGWHPEKDRHPDKIRTPFIQYEWQGGIELTAMMLQYYQHTQDDKFLKETILPLAKETFRLSPTSMRGQSKINGWAQDSIFAACVGDAEGAAQRLIARSRLFHDKSRFPAFWGPNFDWIPDQDHGGVNMIALQHMLIQTEPFSDKIHLCPAWPKGWECSFKLHVSGNTTVQGRVINGKVVNLIVSPELRKKDIVNYLNTDKN